jgi:hypothetical protein
LRNIICGNGIKEEGDKLEHGNKELEELCVTQGCNEKRIKERRKRRRKGNQEKRKYVCEEEGKEE